MADTPVETVKERVDIVALISESLPLKRAGANYKARCPFHQEDTPSFIVSPSRQTFHCFGCSKSGDAFSWLMEREGMSFPEALRVLAQRAGITLAVDRTERREEREQLRATLDLAATFYHRILMEAAEASAALSYLAGRGIAASGIQAWRLGYCPPGSSRIEEKARERGVSAEDLVRSGVLHAGFSGRFEFFHGRILFPLADHHGSVVGLAGRVFEGGDASAFAQASADRPKYINSPETALYTKSKVLYGLDRAKEAIRRDNLAVLVEGYTDVIASHQAGVAAAVATAGTALTEEHLRLLRRFTDRLALAFDADAAGGTATRRAVDLALAAGFIVSAVVLPSGEDPADLAVRDPAAWREALVHREDVFPFLLRRALAKSEAETPDGKRAIAADLLPVIAQVPDGVVQGGYLQHLAAALRVDARFLYEDLRRLRAVPSSAGRASSSLPISPDPGARPVADLQLQREERFLTLLLAEPTLVPSASAHLPAEAFVIPHARVLYAALHSWYTHERASGGTVVPVDVTGASSAAGVGVLRAQLGDDLRERLDVLLLRVDVEREGEEWNPVPEAETLLRALLLAHARRGLQHASERLRSAVGDERRGALEDVAERTAELARAERVTLTE